MSGRLYKKVAIVTGGAAGVGLAICRRFAREGANVVVACGDTEAIDGVVIAISREGGIAVGYYGDLTSEAGAQACVEKAIGTFGKLDVLVNTAGLSPLSIDTASYSLADFNRTIELGMRAAFLMTRASLPYLWQTRGCILTAGAEAGNIGAPQDTLWGATLGWLHAFTRSVALEQAPRGVRANCVCAYANDFYETAGGTVELPSTAAVDHPATVDEIANAYVFLASDEARSISGSLFSVGGGKHVGRKGANVYSSAKSSESTATKHSAL